MYPSVLEVYSIKQGRTQKYDRGFPYVKGNVCYLIIKNSYVHTQIVLQICGVLVSRGIDAKSPMLRPKALLLHADT